MFKSWPQLAEEIAHAYVARSRLWVQALDEWEPRALAGTESAVRPFWSPDSQWIAYFRSEMLGSTISASCSSAPRQATPS